MEFQNLIEKRRSIRKYNAEGSVSRRSHGNYWAAQEAPSWENSQTGRYYCLTSEEMTSRFRSTCLPEGNALKTQNAALIVTTFVRDRSGFQKDGTPDNELGNGWGCYDLGLQNATLLLKALRYGIRNPGHRTRETQTASEIFCLFQKKKSSQQLSQLAFLLKNLHAPNEKKPQIL